jgi:hypothetical protein
MHTTRTGTVPGVVIDARVWRVKMFPQRIGDVFIVRTTRSVPAKAFAAGLEVAATELLTGTAAFAFDVRWNWESMSMTTSHHSMIAAVVETDYGGELEYLRGSLNHLPAGGRNVLTRVAMHVLPEHFAAPRTPPVLCTTIDFVASYLSKLAVAIEEGHVWDVEVSWVAKTFRCTYATDLPPEFVDPGPSVDRLLMPEKDYGSSPFWPRSFENRSEEPSRLFGPRVQPRRCDLCDRVAVWMHPAGGYRCDRCPRPEAT